MGRYKGVTPKVKRTYAGNTITLDSQLEAKTFDKLREKYFNLEIKIHYPLTINKANEFFPVQTWKIDFLVLKRGRIMHLVESKGVFDAHFKSRLIMLSNHNADLIRNLLIVHYPNVKIPRWLKQFNHISINDF